MINKSAVEMAEALSKGEITSVELTKAHLKQINFHGLHEHIDYLLTLFFSKEMHNLHLKLMKC